MSKLKIAALSLGLFGALLAPECSANPTTNSALPPLVIPGWVMSGISTKVQELARQKDLALSGEQISEIHSKILEKVLAAYGNDVTKIPAAATPDTDNLIQAHTQAALQQ